MPGIGRKSAERLVLELKDKMLAVGVDPASQPATTSGRAGEEAVVGQVREALEGLGWSAKQADGALSAIARDPDAPTEVSDLLRAALRELGR